LAGVIATLAEVACQYDARYETARFNFRSKHLSICAEYPFLSKFPYPIQLLLAGQLEKANERQLYDDIELKDLGVDL